MSRIFEQTELGSLRPANRLVRSATFEAMADPQGRVTDGLVSLYRELARGQIGLIVSSYLYVRADGRQWTTQLGADRDDQIPGLSRLAETVHKNGGVIVGQIVHCGGQASREAIGGTDPVAPSEVPSPGYAAPPRALTTGEIDGLIGDFADAAFRLKTAGFDGVQLHGAHGYLLSQFLSPSRNRRTDQFGGTLANRARFTMEVLKGIRNRVGPSFPVLIKLNGHDFLDGSTTEQDACYLAGQLAEARITAIEVSGGTPGSGKLGAVRTGIELSEDEGYFLPQARAIRKATPGIPLILVGGLRSIDKMESILASGDVEYFSMSRPLIREPHLPQRWQTGNRSRAACISCSGCFKPALRGSGVRCIKKGMMLNSTPPDAQS